MCQTYSDPRVVEKYGKFLSQWLMTGNIKDKNTVDNRQFV